MNEEYQDPNLQASRDNDYVRTGNDILLDQPELEKYVAQLLQEYDANPQSIKSPYTEAIIYKMDDGRFIEIPEDLQNSVISKWNAVKQMNKGKSIEYANDLPKPKPKPKPKSILKHQPRQEPSNWHNLLIAVITILMLFGLAYYCTLPKLS